MAGKNSTFLAGPILPALMKFSLPVLLALLLQALYGAADLWTVGKFCGEADVSAVAVGSQTILIVTGMVAGLSMGTTVLLGRMIGAGNDDGAARVIGTSVTVFAVLGVILGAVLIFAAPFITEAMNTPSAAFEKTVGYIRICGGGSLFIVGYNLISAIFRGMENSKAPFVFVLIACIINIAGDILLIKGFGMETEGTAIATIAAQGISVALSIIYMKKAGLPFPFRRKHLRPERAAAAGIVMLGSPIALQDMCNEISYLILIGFVNNLGVTASAGVGVAEKLVMFILLIPMSYMQSISAFTAQNMGAGQIKRAEGAMWKGMATAALLGGIISYIALFHGDMLSSVFTGDEAVIRASAEFLSATSIECFILSIAYCFTGYYNGLGKTRFVMAQGLAAIFLVKIPYGYFASERPQPELFDIGLSTVYAAAFTLIVCVVYYVAVHRKSRKKPDRAL